MKLFEFETLIHLIYIYIYEFMKLFTIFYIYIYKRFIYIIIEQYGV